MGISVFKSYTILKDIQMHCLTTPGDNIVTTSRFDFTVGEHECFKSDVGRTGSQAKTLQFGELGKLWKTKNTPCSCILDQVPEPGGS